MSDLTRLQIAADPEAPTSNVRLHSTPFHRQTLLERMMPTFTRRTKKQAVHYGQDAEFGKSARQEVALRVEKNITEAKLTEITRQFTESEFLLKTANLLRQILAPSKGNKDRIYTPAQTEAAQDCFSALVDYAEADNSENFKKLQTTVFDLEQALDIKRLVSEIKKEIKRLLSDLRKVIVNADESVAGIELVAENLLSEDRTRTDSDELANLRVAIGEQGRTVVAEYQQVKKQLEELLAKLSAEDEKGSLKNEKAVSGVVKMFTSGTIKTVYLAEFNTEIDKLNELIESFGKILNLKKSRPELAVPEVRKFATTAGVGEIITIEHKTSTESKITPDRAREILQADYFGPEAVADTFGVKLEAKDIPPIPFTEREIKRAKELGQFLILRVESAPDGQALTMEKMNELLKQSFAKDKKGKILYNTDWYQNEDFYKIDTPKMRWALTGKSLVPDSTSKNYLQQTEQLVAYLREQIFAGQELPEQYQLAIAEFDNKKADIAKLLSSNWQEAAKQLSKLSLNQLTRQTPAEVLYDLLVYFKRTGRLLENRYTWTARLSSAGCLVFVGYFGAGGAPVRGDSPGHSHGLLGVSFARSL